MICVNIIKHGLFNTIETMLASTGKCNSMGELLMPQRAKNIANQRANITQWSNYLPQRAEILSQRSQRVNSTGK